MQIDHAAQVLPRKGETITASNIPRITKNFLTINAIIPMIIDNFMRNTIGFVAISSFSRSKKLRFNIASNHKSKTSALLAL